tara:strand:- start:2662 stop:4347 length:1686 start_codon:yes stop_codon:yes gene_type:complete
MATTASAVINTTDTGSGTPTVPDASVTTKWQEYIWIRHLEAGNANKAKIYVWNPNASSDSTYLKWQEVASSGAFSDLTGTATIAQLPTGITVSNLSIDGAITNTHLAGGITNAKLAGSILHDKITSVNASTVTSVSGSKIPVNTIPTLTNTNIDSILATGSVDWVKVNVDDGEIPGAKIKDSLEHAQINSVNATKITTGTLPPARLEYMFERNLPIITLANATGTYNLHTALGSNAFEGIIRMVAVANSDEVIIALPNPALSAYVQKAAKLSIYRGSSTGKVTIKVCNSGTNSSSFATNKIVDNNNGIITDQVIVMPQLATAAARKVVIDLLCDSKASGTDNGDGQWIITGGAAVTGKGKVSVAGFRTGGGTNAPPERGAQLDKIGIGKAPSEGSGETKEVGTDDGKIPPATTARIFGSPQLIDHGANYTIGQIITVADNASDWSTEAEMSVDWVEDGPISTSSGSRTKTINTLNLRYADSELKTGVYSGDDYKYTKEGGQKLVRVLTKLAAANSVTTTTPSTHATVAFFLEGIQPNGTDGNALNPGDSWYDPWTGGYKKA